MELKAEYMAGWEHVAAKNGAESVEAYAQAQLDALGESFEAERLRDDRTAQVQLFDLALKLPEEDRLALKELVLTRAASHGLIPAG